MTPDGRHDAAPRSPGREVEISLVVTSPDPERTFGRLARLRAIGPYTLKPRGSEHIVDRYFDTPDREFSRRGLALRLRSIDQTTLIGLKGRTRSASTTTEDRFEREQPFSPDLIGEIAERIGRRISARPAVKSGASPEDLLRVHLDARLIQLRETKRLLRSVEDSENRPGIELAELALDRVLFKFEDQAIRHYEVEVEAKRTGRGTKAAKDVAGGLLSEFGDDLAEWPYGKLPTGRAIEEYLRRKLLSVGPDGVLTSEDYDRLERSLAQSAA